jgi:hypothetical protein
MLFFLCCWVVLLVVARVAGASVLAFTSSGANLDRGDLFFAQVWTGLFSLASALLALSLGGPVSPVVSLCLLAAVAMFFLLPRVRREVKRANLSWSERAAFVILLLAVAWDVTGPVELYDTGLYHYQMVRWLSQAGTVRGMALLHYRLGFSSSWFALSAVFDAGRFLGRAGAVLNGLALALGVLHLAIAASRVLSGTARNCDAFLAGALPLVLLICFAARFQISPTPNLPVALGAVMSGWAMLLIRPGASEDWNLPVFLAAGSVGLKISSLPLFAAIFAMGLAASARRGRPTAPILASLLAIVGLAAPVLLANRVSSGCPLFPSSAFCAATPSAVSAAKANEVSVETTNWARDSRPLPQTDRASTGIWIGRWVRDPFNLLFAGIALLATAAVLVLRAANEVYIAGAIASAAVFAAAPSIRFLAGPVGMLSGSLAQSLYRRFTRKEPRPGTQATARVLFSLAMLACAIIFCDAALREETYRRRTHIAFPSLSTERLLVPPPIQSAPPGWKVSRTSYIVFTVPAGDQCWTLPLPCTPYPPSASLGLCRPTVGMRGGFCLAPQPPK